VLEIVPRVALHVTAVFVVFVTVAVNCCVQPDGTDTVCGEMLTATAGIVTVMVAFPDLLVSSVLVAVTVADPAVAGAVKLPFALTVPALADHVTAELKLPVPVTAAVQVAVPFVRTDVGEHETLTDVMVGFWFEDDDPPPPLHEARTRHKTITSKQYTMQRGFRLERIGRDFLVRGLNINGCCWFLRSKPQEAKLCPTVKAVNRGQ
jgi:hypothetical protein